LDGSIRWARTEEMPGRVRITIHLTKVTDGTIIWSEVYDREMTDIFDLQIDIAAAVAAQLGMQVNDVERATAAPPPTDNLDAYHAYLQGKYYHSRGLDFYFAENWEHAIKHFERAVALD